MSACSDDDVDALILSFAQVQWRKVAMIMSQVVDACSCRGGDADLHHIAERICALFEDGQLEAQGDFVDVATQRGKAARRHRASKQKYGLPENTDIDWVQWVPRLCADAGVTILP